MNVEHYMTKDVVTAPPSMRLTEAISIMQSNNFHRIPIVEDGRYVGLITEEIIAENSPSSASSLSIYEMNYLLDKTTVGQLMNRQAATTTADISIEEAASKMNRKGVSVLTVVNEANEVVGIITHKDIFKALIDLTGYNNLGARLEVTILDDKIGVIAHITNVLAENNISLSHIFVSHPSQENIKITVQTHNADGEPAKRVLEAEGYHVKVLDRP